MAVTSDQQRLHGYLSKIKLPSTLRCDAKSTESHLLTERQAKALKDHLPHPQLGYTSTFYQNLNSILSASAQVIAPAIASGGGDLDDFLTKRADEATAVAANEMQSGELGITVFFESFLLIPLNRLLRHIFAPFNHRLYWQVVGSGPSAKPDIHLQFYPNGSMRPMTLVVLEFKTPKALDNGVITSMPGSINKGQLFVSNDGSTMMLEQAVDTPREIRYPQCRIMDQMLLQALSRNAYFALITNYNYIAPFARLDDGITFAAGDAMPISQSSQPTHLASSPAGMLLALSLMATCGVDGSLMRWLRLDPSLPYFQMPGQIPGATNIPCPQDQIEAMLEERAEEEKRNKTWYNRLRRRLGSS